MFKEALYTTCTLISVGTYSFWQLFQKVQLTTPKVEFVTQPTICNRTHVEDVAYEPGATKLATNYLPYFILSVLVELLVVLMFSRIKKKHKMKQVVLNTKESGIQYENQQDEEMFDIILDYDSPPSYQRSQLQCSVTPTENWAQETLQDMDVKSLEVCNEFSENNTLYQRMEAVNKKLSALVLENEHLKNETVIPSTLECEEIKYYKQKCRKLQQLNNKLRDEIYELTRTKNHPNFAGRFDWKY